MTLKEFKRAIETLEYPYILYTPCKKGHLIETYFCNSTMIDSFTKNFHEDEVREKLERFKKQVERCSQCEHAR